MKNIILQQKEELAFLSSLQYQTRRHIENVEEFLDTPIIKLITGPRRAGKSVFALQILKNKNFAYLNFDDALLLENFDEDAVMQALLEVYPQFTHLLLDEVQNLPSWDLWVSKLKRRGLNMVITGSNARMLSSEMATVLTGRYVELEILPFSLKETLEYKHFCINPETIESKAALSNEIEAYMRTGGFPEVAKAPSIVKSYVGTLFDSIVLKDVAQRHNIRKTQELYSLADFLITNYCNPISFNEIAKTLSMNSVNTIKKFCDYLAEPYLFFYLPRFDYKIKQIQRAPKKIYVVDNGFVFARSFELSSNYGRQFENMVFTELLRRGCKVGQSLFYYRTKYDKEIDFVIKKRNNITSLIQASYDISSLKTRERELSALIAASKELKCSNLFLITWDKDDTIEYNNNTIHIISAKNWFLNNQT